MSSDERDLTDEESIEENDEDYLSDTPLDVNPTYPNLDDNMDSVIIITNLPEVPEAKLEKLTKVVNKLVSRCGNLATFPEKGYTGIVMPLNKEKNSTCGFAFVEYETAEEAIKARQVLQGYKFDKSHLLQVFEYDVACRVQDVVDEEFVQPEPAPFVPRPNTTSWLLDDAQRDQFVIREGSETVVCWNDGMKLAPVVDYDGHREKAAGVVWCEYYVQFSPKGSYLATLVPNKGVIVWGGEKYEKLARFPASGVQFVVFSPQENYLLTCNNKKDDPNAIKIFHITTGKLLRAFKMFPKGLEDAGKEAPPPPFQWSHDDKYIARMGKDLISIYETPSMKLLEQKSLLTNGILEFTWSPKANLISYWAPEEAKGNSPAHVDIISIPSRQKLRQKNLFNVTSCSMVWQDEGEFLAVKVTRHTKSKKTLYNNVELFRIKEKGTPVEMLEIKDAVMALAWEPRGSRFAMIHAESPTSTKVNVSFYDMMKKQEPKKNKGSRSSMATIVPELHQTDVLEGKQCNCLFWSPAGGVILLAALGDSAASGSLEFYDLSGKTTVVKEHYRANAVSWDPSGRTVATIVSQPIEGGHFKYAMDNGYVIWSFQGKQLSQKNYEHFYQFQWRPRQNILSKEKIQTDVLKNLKKYEKQFDAADKERKMKKTLQESKGKRILRSKFRARMSRLREFYVSQKEERLRLLGGYDSDDESNYVVKDFTRESVLEEKTKTINA